jgi:hypothetical protein
MINDIKESFNDIKGSIADMVVDNSETTDDYGKLGIKAVFGVLALIDIAIAAFMLLLCFCSGKCCNKCCCCRCIFKLFTHLLWNILALLMIIVFLVGSLFALIGKVGSDAMSVISYVVSEDNIGAGGDGILVDQLGENKKYINRCIGGDGKIEEEFNLDLSQINSINNISDAENQIREAKREFREKKDTLFTYNAYIAELEKRVGLTTDELSLLHIEHDNKVLNLKVVLEEMNQGIQGYDDLKAFNEKWDINSNNLETCTYSTSEPLPSHGEIKTFNPKLCKPYDRKWVRDLTDTKELIKNKAEIISNILDFVVNADQEGQV